MAVPRFFGKIFPGIRVVEVAGLIWPSYTCLLVTQGALPAAPPIISAAAGLRETFGPVAARPVVSGLTQPLFLTAAPGDETCLFILEKTGAVRIYDTVEGILRPTPFLTLSPILTYSERGLLGMAFHPDYEENGYFFVNFSEAEPGDPETSGWSAAPAGDDVPNL